MLTNDVSPAIDQNAGIGRWIAIAFGYLTVAILVHFVSTILLNSYTLGDQESYRALFDALEGEGISAVAELQFDRTGSSEPLFGLLMWIAVNYLPLNHTQFISFCNSLLAVCLLGYLRKNVAHIATAPLFFTNYYFIVLLTGAERLKFGYMFLLLASLLVSKWLKIGVIAICLGMHFQSAFLFVATLAGSGVSFAKSAVSSMTTVAMMTIIAATALLVLALFWYQDAIYAKILYYMDDAGVDDAGRLAVLLGAGLLFLNDRWRFTATMLILMVAAAAVGGERVNMIGFTAFTHQVLQEKKSVNPIFLVILAYYSYKSIDFVFRIFEFGQGFDTTPF
jgi:hypothetical protein